jgi:ABC-2 type transport system permease protein
MNWRKMGLVARREYLFNFRRPSFLFMVFGFPALILVVTVIATRLIINRETNLDNFQTVGYIDQAGVIRASAPNPDDYRAIVDPARPDAAFDDLKAYADAQVEAGNLDAYFVLGADYRFTGQVGVYARQNIPAALTENIEEFLRDNIALNAPADLPVPAERLSQPSEPVFRSLETGETLTIAAMIGRFVLPMIFVFIYFMATSTTAQFMMSGVVEEKENRLMEILATSLRPLELLWGKLGGLAGLALTQIGLWVITGIVIALSVKQGREFIGGADFSAGDLLLMATLFVLNFLLFSSILLSIGAAVTAEAESRQIAGFLSFIAILPVAFNYFFITQPDGAFALTLTFFPLTSATAIVLRMGLTDVPSWQIAVSLALQAVSTIGVMWLAAKVFRLGMLMYGKALTPRLFWKAWRQGQVVSMTRPQTQ